MRPQKKEETFENVSIELDGYDWTGCTFKNCTFVIAEGDFRFTKNKVSQCKLSLKGKATTILKMVDLFFPGAIPIKGNKPKTGNS